MKKLELIQEAINAINGKTYLEIGVENGVNFMPIKIKHKIAVDPKFAVTRKSKLKWMVLNWSNFFSSFFECTSDVYFSQHKNTKYDVVFVDGLHTFEQSLKDVENSLESLNEGGIIFVHDCIPPHEAAAFNKQLTHDEALAMNIKGWTPEWCGDVWKTICYLRMNRRDLRIFTLDLDYGLAVIMRGKPEGSISIELKALNCLSFKEFCAKKNELLNIKSLTTMADFLKLIT